ncbi:MAG: hypothetical protein QGI14_07835 [Candidatus Poseidonia sp.]|nr:hypothetical protein [Poseidonia sp.]MEC7600238.1 hypothetical protein [Candidatus Thermoplasmatota archaeon]MEC8707733.1 hypothetical protein [Candidatus Thermoplasmatota archaeon]MEC8766128.1 hypothetical protein [Candidatus Thermoplasmatota archaeon]DAC56464.1 MAG TPA: hypothetical protein D7I08_07595 [Candidatus Poseidoniales archaeon]
MSLAGTLGLFAMGAGIGHIGPRLPTLWMTRAAGFNRRFPPHPEPVPLSPYLTQRVLHMRVFYWLSFVLAALVLVFGAASLRWGSAMFGFGLWVASTWTVLSRIQSLLAGRPAPWSKELAVHLQTVVNQSTLVPCCDEPFPVWGMRSIDCSECGTVLSRTARPDLGRTRSDGWMAGTLRLLMTDGYPMAEPLPEPKVEEE